jgi:PhnB protein
MRVDIGLRFPGTCEEAFRFYQSVFGGELQNLQRYKEMREHGYTIPPEDEEKIAFVGMKLGENVQIGADDYTPSSGQKYVQGNNCSIGLSVDSREEVDRYFRLLSAGGEVSMPPQEVYWGEYCAYLTDRFGVSWGVTYHIPGPGSI